ncbi:MAG: hypothetical protein AABZ76_07310 [Pseudomonadota bacterium]
MMEIEHLLECMAAAQAELDWNPDAADQVAWYEALIEQAGGDQS